MSIHSLRYGRDLFKRKDSCRVISEVHSAAFDLDLAGVGGTPWVGDMGRTGIRIPPAPTTSQSNRYLFRLCGVEIPSGYAVVIRGLRQLLTIRGVRTIPTPPGFHVYERDVRSPVWQFADGNVSWHLRWQKNQFAPIVSDSAQLPGTSPEMRGLDSVLLYNPPFVPYSAPASGLPPGDGIASYGTFGDIRFPWERSLWAMSELIVGPGAVVFYASVQQTNFLTRPAVVDPPPFGVLEEDQFITGVPNAIYGLVGGAIIYELFPCCGKLKSGARGLR